MEYDEAGAVKRVPYLDDATFCDADPEGVYQFIDDDDLDVFSQQQQPERRTEFTVSVHPVYCELTPSSL